MPRGVVCQQRPVAGSIAVIVRVLPQVGRDLAVLSQLIGCADGEYRGLRHDRHLSAASISRVPAPIGAYGSAQAECWRRSRSDGI